MYFRGTTPAFLLFIEEGPKIEQTDKVAVALNTGEVEYFKDGESLTIDYDANTVGVFLTEEETWALNYKDKVTEIQVRVETQEGEVWMTPVARVNLYDSLFENYEGSHKSE